MFVMPLLHALAIVTAYGNLCRYQSPVWHIFALEDLLLWCVHYLFGM